MYRYNRRDFLKASGWTAGAILALGHPGKISEEHESLFPDAERDRPGDRPDIPKWEGVRGERYVYARYYEQEPAYEFLHDLETDPDQLVNLAADPEYREILTAIRKRCDEFKETLN